MTEDPLERLYRERWGQSYTPSRQSRQVAADDGLTLADLVGLVMDAHSAGIPDSAPVYARTRVTWSTTHDAVVSRLTVGPAPQDSR